MDPKPQQMVVHQRRDGRWVVSLEKNGYDKDRGGVQDYRVRKQYVTGGDHATWQCAKSWAESWLRLRARWGYRVLELVVDKTKVATR